MDERLSAIAAGFQRCRDLVHTGRTDDASASFMSLMVETAGLIEMGELGLEDERQARNGLLNVVLSLIDLVDGGPGEELVAVAVVDACEQLRPLREWADPARDSAKLLSLGAWICTLRGLADGRSAAGQGVVVDIVSLLVSWTTPSTVTAAEQLLTLIGLAQRSSLSSGDVDRAIGAVEAQLVLIGRVGLVPRSDQAGQELLEAAFFAADMAEVTGRAVDASAVWRVCDFAVEILKQAEAGPDPRDAVTVLVTRIAMLRSGRYAAAGERDEALRVVRSASAAAEPGRSDTSRAAACLLRCRAAEILADLGDEADVATFRRALAELHDTPPAAMFDVNDLVMFDCTLLLVEHRTGADVTARVRKLIEVTEGHDLSRGTRITVQAALAVVTGDQDRLKMLLRGVPEDDLGDVSPGVARLWRNSRSAWN